MWEIVGDAEICGKIKTCMIWVAGNTKEEAEEKLKSILANPTEYERERLAEHTNVRVENSKEPWYLDSGNFRD